jgi:hypothetical protein
LILDDRHNINVDPSVTSTSSARMWLKEMLGTLSLQDENDPLVQWALVIIFRLRGAWGALALIAGGWPFRIESPADLFGVRLSRYSCEEELKHFVARGGDPTPCVLSKLHVIIFPLQALFRLSDTWSVSKLEAPDNYLTRYAVHSNLSIYLYCTY